MESFDKYANNYDDLLKDPLRDKFAGGSEFFIKQKIRIVERRLRQGFGHRPLRVLDAGCGQGTVYGNLVDQIDAVQLPDVATSRIRQSTLIRML
jgi:2-polyprenyl-3-methyl-5-hydroxy-6-metoxy-1,4-benzoquinol methylase